MLEEMTTKRLLMREVKASDRMDWIRLTGDERVWRFIAPTPLTPDQAWEKLLVKAGTYPLTGLGNWAVCDKSSKTLLGEFGFFEAYRGIVGTQDMIEAGWSYFPEFWDQGYATEASEAAHDWFDRHFPTKDTFAIINAQNEGSLRVAQKSGYQELRRYADDRGTQVILTRASAP